MKTIASFTLSTVCALGVASTASIHAQNLTYHLPLNETANDMPPELDSNFEPSEERTNEWLLTSAEGADSMLVKGAIGASLPQFGAPSPGAAVSGSTGALGVTNPFGRIELAQRGPLSPGTDPFTIALHFKMDEGAPVSGQRHIISSNSGQSGRWNLHVMPGGDQLRFFHNSPDSWGADGNVGANGFDLTTSFEQNQWYHFAMTRDTDNVFTLYLDGDEVFSSVNSGAFTDSNNGVFLSRFSDFSTEAFIGLLDDFRMYDDALSSEEIQGLAIPEPSTYAAIIGALALGGVVLLRRRRNRR
jgi:hypothetical protein